MAASASEARAWESQLGALQIETRAGLQWSVQQIHSQEALQYAAARQTSLIVAPNVHADDFRAFYAWVQDVEAYLQEELKIDPNRLEEVEKQLETINAEAWETIVRARAERAARPRELSPQR